MKTTVSDNQWLHGPGKLIVVGRVKECQREEQGYHTIWVANGHLLKIIPRCDITIV